MVAIATPTTTVRPRQRPAAARLHVVDRRPVRQGASRFRLALTAAMVAVVAVAGLYLVRAEPVPAAGTVAVGDTTHTVAPGETMWSIATAVAPAGEAATYVERLVEVNGTARVTPGQVLALPVP